MQKREVKTNNAPKPVGPYSQAVMVESCNKTVYLSGQIGLDPLAGNLVSESLEAEVEQVLDNLTAVLGEVGLNACDVVFANISLTDVNDFAVVNQIYSQWLEGCKVMPARQTIGVAALPKGARVEISVVACE